MSPAADDLFSRPPERILTRTAALMSGSTEQRWLSTVRDTARTQLWPFPVLGVVVAVVLGVGLPLVDAAVDGALPPALAGLLFSGGPDAARTVLSSVSGSLITVTSLTFSLTVVTLQLASSQFSPRLLRTFTRDRFVHLTLALFLATFVYALTVLRTVRSSDDGGAFVPQIAVTVAYLLTVVSVLGLVVFLAHLARQIRVETIVATVHGQGSATLNAVLDDRGPDTEARPPVPTPPTGALPLPVARSGFLVRVDEPDLLDAATDARAVVLLDEHPGAFLVAGTPVASAWPLDSDGALNGQARDRLTAAVGEAVVTGVERTAAQDVGFALRQLTDVVNKALSPGINDPSTAIHTLGHSAALLCEIAGRDLGPRVLCDGDGRVRVVLRRHSFADLLDLAVAQPRRYGAADPAVLARLIRLLREVGWCAAPEQRSVVVEQLDRLRVTAGDQDFDDQEQRRLGELADEVQAALDRRWPAETTSR